MLQQGYLADCYHGAPTSAYLILLGFLVVHMFLTVFTLQDQSSQFWDSKKSFMVNMSATPVHLFWTALEFLDMGTDIVFVGSATACNDDLQSAWTAAWHQSPAFSFLAPLMQRITFGGVAVLSFVIAAYVPQIVNMPILLTLPYLFVCMIVLWILFGEDGFSGSVFSWVGISIPIYAAVCLFKMGWTYFSKNVLARPPARLALYAAMLTAEPYIGDIRDQRTYFIVLPKLLFENLLQLWLQSSFFALNFDRTSHGAKYKALASIGLGFGASVCKVPLIGRVILRDNLLLGSLFCQHGSGMQRLGYHLLACILLVPVLLLLFLILAVPAKVYFAYHCQSHLWNVIGGCVT